MNQPKTYLKKGDESKAKQAMRSKIIAMLMAWKPDKFGRFDYDKMKHAPVMSEIYKWVNDYGHKKPLWLNKYSYSDLVILVSQIGKITKGSKK